MSGVQALDIQVDYISVTCCLSTCYKETGRCTGAVQDAGSHRALNRRQDMLLQHQILTGCPELKGVIRPVVRGIEAVNRTVMIRTHEDEV